MSDSLENTNGKTRTPHTHLIRKLGPGLIYNIYTYYALQANLAQSEGNIKY